MVRVLQSSQVRALFPLFQPFWEGDPRLKSLWNIIACHDPHMRFVGGCVRDALIGRQTSDIDIVTTLPAEVILNALQTEGYSVLTQGLTFGSLRLVLEPYQVDVTTRRIDRSTDGRWATVAYTDSWIYDAQRRDLTINALSMDRAGMLFDAVGGVDDLLHQRVRFIGDPEQRIQEDALRILRFIRFHQYYGHGHPDAHAMGACFAQRDHVARLSKERIWQELSRILQGPNLHATLGWIHQIALDCVLWGVPLNMDALSLWQSIVSALSFDDDPLRMLLTGLQASHADVQKVAQSCAWPRFFKQRILKALHAPSIVPCPWDVRDPADRRQEFAAQDQWAIHAIQQIMCGAYTFQQAQAKFQDHVSALQFLKNHSLPLTGQDFVEENIPLSRIAPALTHARRLWVEHKGQIDRSTLKKQILSPESGSSHNVRQRGFILDAENGEF